ncbi:MAG: Plug domain-containing protein, partial [Treponema sp.]|nr:Plug domain-containing protein [Treponema sp.]
MYIKAFFFTLIFLILPLSLFARDITVTVMDASLDLPLEGTVIRTREGKEYICDENGKAVIQVPDDRQTIIYATYPGYERGVLNIPLTGNLFTINLNLSNYLQGQELVVEAPIPGSNETKTGRSVAVNSKEIAQTAEIGIFEDVMSTIKLLPGVNYSGAFNTQPSIRGGQPGDMGASLDGFFISNPYHWRGGYSIFDPHMVQNAQLSHGVFSTRYGHTISGLLEVTAKKPSSTETMFEFGINTSMTNFNLSVPLSGKGGLLFMGRVTYYDPLVAAAKELAKTYPKLSGIKYANKAPYIRAGAIEGNYSFADNLELKSTG